MLYVKKLENGAAAANLNADKALVGEDVLVRISRLGFSITYLPASSAQWRSFPPSPRASELIQSPGTVCFGAFLDNRLIGVAAIFLLVGVTMTYAVHKIRRDAIVEDLRLE